jgi:hypothetical protein
MFYICGPAKVVRGGFPEEGGPENRVCEDGHTANTHSESRCVKQNTVNAPEAPNSSAGPGLATVTGRSDAPGHRAHKGDSPIATRKLPSRRSPKLSLLDLNQAVETGHGHWSSFLPSLPLGRYPFAPLSPLSVYFYLPLSASPSPPPVLVAALEGGRTYRWTPR